MKPSNWLVIIGKGNTREQGREISRRFDCETWGINNVERYPELSLLWEMHPWTDEIKQLNPVQIDTLPVMMQEQYIDVPNAIRYPFDGMKSVYGNIYANNTIAYMLMLAIASRRPNGERRFTSIYLAGIDYRSADRVEMEFERACTEYWIGYANARGISVYYPEESNLMTFAGYVKGVKYGYDKIAPELVMQHREQYSHTAAEILLGKHGDPEQFKKHDHDAFYSYLVQCIKQYKKPEHTVELNSKPKKKRSKKK
jgi:hypothetical protein